MPAQAPKINDTENAIKTSIGYSFCPLFLYVYIILQANTDCKSFYNFFSLFLKLIILDICLEIDGVLHLFIHSHNLVEQVCIGRIYVDEGTREGNG